MEKRTNVLERNRWADELLKGLSKEEQIKWLTEKLANPSRDGEDELDLLEGLATVFEDKVAFREQLCHIYSRLITIATEFPKLATTKFSKLAATAAKKILEGWDWKWEVDRSFANTRGFMPEYYERSKRILQMNSDARGCFQFFCQSYKSANPYENPYGGGDEQIKKLLTDVLHEHINTHKIEWRAEDLNGWIIAEGVPRDIVVVLAGARVRIGGNVLAQREVSLSQCFQTQNRSQEAIALIAAQMETVRRTEELAQALVEKVRPTDRYGAFNPETVFTYTSASVEWKLETAKLARIKIDFHRTAEPKDITAVQKVRDEILSKVENPPRILIEAEGPDGFSWKEE